MQQQPPPSPPYTNEINDRIYFDPNPMVYINTETRHYLNNTNYNLVEIHPMNDMHDANGKDPDTLSVDDNVFVDPAQKMLPILTAQDYYRDPTCMDRYKIADLRAILKHYKSKIKMKFYNYDTKWYSRADLQHLRANLKKMYDFSLTGTKQKMIERIVAFFRQETHVVRIQRRVRGGLVRTMYRLRGPASKDRSICVNDSDFYTLEPLADIPLDNFFSYQGQGDFVYGFELTSIVKHLQNRTRNVLNPYNRELLDPVVPSIRKLVRICKIVDAMINPVVEVIENVYVAAPSSPPPVHRLPTPPLHRLPTPPPQPSQQTDFTLRSTAHMLVDYDAVQMVNQIREIRSKPLDERVQSLFMEIDQLGHYTQPEWFSQLTRLGYVRYFRCLRDIWNYRAQLSSSVKHKICPLWDPFVILTTEQMNSHDLDDHQLKSLCLSVMEDMVLTGIDSEFRMLGAFHVLSALTVVSLPARESMRWLYESIV